MVNLMQFHHFLQHFDTKPSILYPMHTTHFHSERIERAWSILQELYMPRKNATKEFKVGFGDTYFVACSMSEPQLRVFTEWYAENEADMGVYLQNSLAAGDKLSMSYDLSNDCIIASFTIRDDKSPAYGAIITARSDNGMEAFYLLLYKRWVFLDLENLDTTAQQNRRG